MLFQPPANLSRRQNPGLGSCSEGQAWVGGGGGSHLGAPGLGAWRRLPASLRLWGPLASLSNEGDFRTKLPASTVSYQLQLFPVYSAKLVWCANPGQRLWEYSSEFPHFADQEGKGLLQPQRVAELGVEPRLF